MTKPRHESTGIVELQFGSPAVVKVNNCAFAHLVKGNTVNGNTYYAYDISGREVCITSSAYETKEMMKWHLNKGTIF